MKISGLLVATCALLLSTCFSVSAFAVDLVQDGAPVADIILGRDADKVTLFAAEELQKYIEKISGTKLAIKESSKDKRTTIYVGNACSNVSSDLPPKPRYEGDDNFVLKTKDNNVCIAGCSPRATLFAVYAFLEELGCHWLLPDDPDGLLPSMDTITWFKKEVVEAPSFPYRISWILGQNITDVLDLFCKQRLNICTVRGKHLLSPSGEAYAAEVIPKARQRGMEVMLMGHLMGMLLPSEEYFDAHPEWCPLVNGERVTTIQNGPFTCHTDLCVSNSEAVGALLSAIDNKLLDPYPDVKFWSIWPSDGRGILCECENCRNIGSPTDQAYYLQNLIARHIKKRRGEKPTTYLALAYNMSAVAPDFQRVEALAGGKHIDYIWYADIARCYYHRIFESSECKKRAAKKSRPECHAKGLSHNECYYYHFRQYLENFDGNGIAYAYYWRPKWIHLRPLSGLIADEVRHYHDLGVKGMSNQTATGFTTVGLNYAVHHRLLWDHRTDLAQFNRAYFQALYGQMWQEAFWIHEEFEKRQIAHPNAFFTGCVPANIQEGTKRFLAKAVKALNGQRGGSDLCDREIKKLRLMVELSGATVAKDLDRLRAIAPELVRHELIPREGLWLRRLLESFGITSEAELAQLMDWFGLLPKNCTN